MLSENTNRLSLFTKYKDGEINLDKNMKIDILWRYKTFWYGGSFSQNNLQDHFVFFRDILRPIEELIETEKTNQPNEYESNKNNSAQEGTLGEMIEKLEKDKAILISLAKRQKTAKLITKLFQDLKEIIQKIKINVEEDEDGNNNNYNNYNNYNNIQLPEVIMNNQFNERSPLQNDVKVWVDDDNEKQPIFSYMSDLYQSDILESNILSNFHPYSNPSDFQSPVKLTQSSVVHINSPFRNTFLLQKRKNPASAIYSPIRIEDRKEPLANSLTCVNNNNLFNRVFNVSKHQSPDKYKNFREEAKKYFNDPSHNPKKKWFAKPCLVCEGEIKIRKIDKFCCDNFICKKCITANFSFLTELGYNWSAKEYKSDKCFSQAFNMYYCNYCFIIDEMRNLVGCPSPLCFTYFHKDCYNAVKILGLCSSNDNLSKYSTIIKDFSDRIFSEILEEKVQKGNINKVNGNSRQNKGKLSSEDKSFLIKGMDNGNPLVTLYKINTSTFYIAFIEKFIKFILKNKTIFSPEEYNSNSISNLIQHNSNSYCFKHLCLSCFLPINEFESDEYNGKVTKVCCLTLHKQCYNNTDNSHLEYILGNMNSHFPILHIALARDIYWTTKINIEKFGNKEKGKVFNNCTRLNNLNEEDIIHKTVKKINIVPATMKLPSINTDIRLLSLEEKIKILSTYKEVNSNQNLKLMKKEKEKNRGLVTSKCSCLDEAIKVYTQRNIRKPSKTSLLKNGKFLAFLRTHNYCSEKCNNRVISVECFAETCEMSGEYCKNRYSIGKYYDDLEIVEVCRKGYGLICNSNIKKGDYIIEYLGNIVTIGDVSQLTKNDERHGWYMMGIERDLLIDAYKFGNKSRFINHSCNPNAIVEKWVGPDFYSRLLIFAKTDIPAGTEICYNYNFYYFNDDKEQPCYCKSSNCRQSLYSPPVPRNRSIRCNSPDKNGLSDNNKNIIVDTDFNIWIHKSILKSSKIFNNNSNSDSINVSPYNFLNQPKNEQPLTNNGIFLKRNILLMKKIITQKNLEPHSGPFQQSKNKTNSKFYSRNSTNISDLFFTLNGKEKEFEKIVKILKHKVDFKNSTHFCPIILNTKTNRLKAIFYENKTEEKISLICRKFVILEGENNLESFISKAEKLFVSLVRVLYNIENNIQN